MWPWSPDKRKGGLVGTVWPRSERSSQTSSNLRATQDSRNATETSRRKDKNDQATGQQVDPLGLTILFEPQDCSPSVDIVFVHGLGGSSKRTWSLDQDLELFWPNEWLPIESNFRAARISTFGYDATWSTGGPRNMANLADFARALLSQLRYASVEDQASRIGKLPVIFVVHSMGGLVVKKAYIFGKDQENYKEIVQSTCAILFLATPHRGADLAGVLDRILRFMEPIRYRRKFIEELKKSSSALEDINEQFRHSQSKLEIFSFYETVMMKKHLIQKMIVEKDSSILGYPTEVALPLKADHRGVTKFYGREDPGYVTIRNVLKDLIARFGTVNQNQKTGKTVRAQFRRTRVPDDDLEAFHSRRMHGSCKWILLDPAFQSWVGDRSSQPRIIWLHGPPGCGKSVLTSHVVEHLRELRSSVCQFFFFRYNNRAKRSTTSLLWSLAYQAACCLPLFEQYLTTLGDSLCNLERASARVIWKTLFVNGLLKLHYDGPTYWVVDGIDECYKPTELLSLLTETKASDSSMRLFFAGRNTPRLSTAFSKIAKSFHLDVLEVQNTNEDLIQFIQTEIQDTDIVGTTRQKEMVGTRILELAKGNFLWTRLVLESLHYCYEENQRDRVIASLLPGLTSQYQHMVYTLSSSWKDGDEGLAKAILTLIVCSMRPLTILEMSRALGPLFASQIDLKATIGHLCGDFVQIDSRSRVSMVHHSAREYLINIPGHELYIDAHGGHWTLFKTCISILVDPNWGFRDDQVGTEPFLEYVATSWSFHLNLSGSTSEDELLCMLEAFFNGPWVLRWICVLSYVGHLEQLVRASESLSSFLKTVKSDALITSSIENLAAKNTLELWAAELLRLSAKFGKHLRTNPKVIYGLIPPFCPPNSMLRRLFESSPAVRPIRVNGLSPQAWDDSLVKFSVDRNFTALKILCVDKYFAILTSSLTGNIRVYSTTSYEEVHLLNHLEPVVIMQFSTSGQILATYGQHTTKIWKIATAEVLYTVENPAGVRVLEMVFLRDDTAILTCSNDGLVKRLDLQDRTHSWQAVTPMLINRRVPGGRALGVPRCAAFNHDSTLLAVAFSGYPLLIWNVATSRFDAEFVRGGSGTGNGSTTQSDIIQIDWKVQSGHIFGVYNDGCVFKWRPFDHTKARVLEIDATAIRCSPTGLFLMTTDDEGTLKIWACEDFSLIYKLSYRAMVNDMAISPDGKQFYDLRGSNCNIWVPNLLIRLAEPDDSASETSSTTTGSSDITHVSVSAADMHEPIEAFAVGGKTSVYCIGHPSGTWKIFKSDGEIVHIEPASSLAIEHIIWSDEENYLAFTNVGTTICVKQVSNSYSPDRTVFKKRLGKPILQILFNKSADLLFAATENSLNVWSIDDELGVGKASMVNGEYRWINHPHNEGLLIGFGPKDIIVVGWRTLKQLCHFNMSPFSISSLPHPSSNLGSMPTTSFSTALVRRVLISGNGSYILLQFVQKTSQPIRKERLVLIQTADLEASNMSTISGLTIPESLQDHIDIPLAFVGECTVSPLASREFGTGPAKDHLTFLSKSGWLWTISLDRMKDGGIAKRHFFLPQDWLVSESLGLAQVTRSGMLLCPKDGEVGLIQSGFRMEESSFT